MGGSSVAVGVSGCGRWLLADCVTAWTAVGAGSGF